MALKGQRTKAGDRTRTAILEATLRLLGRVGPDAFSASSLAKEAGVSKATLFHHFGSIEAIPLAAFEEIWHQSLTPDTRELISAHDYFEDLGQQVIISAQKHSEFLRAQVVFVTKAIFDPRLRRRLAASTLQMHRVVVQELAARLPKSLKASEIDSMARMAEMTLDGLMIALVMRKGSNELAESKRAWASFVDLLLSCTGAT
jgi:AcrR family transcriptional regulator